MAAKLSPELRQEIADNPGQAVPLVDELSNRTYFVVGEEFLFLAVEQDKASRARLLALLQEGEESAEVSREEGFARMRAKVQELKDKSA
ncbi:hypothetical protein [Bythopirellula goksoeyrii]|uniref:Uncharacterized protein n=1 Tax=Bythopirellula goksoeyrii TaxID=1400387 RepID=A0A5B9Q8R3_9BACT|nr:hypothetical protein [Bythopirellula goksoeyrii]QEG34069.1 hypothetical protein Pr1d_13410 [Bythopirellula goksoeyrii]